MVVAIALAARSLPAEPLAPIVPIADAPFAQEYREPFVAWPAPVAQGRVAVALDARGELWAAGPWGVVRQSESTWAPPKGHALDGPAFALAAEGEQIWVAAWDGLYRLADGELTRAALEGRPLGVARIAGGDLYAGGPDGLWKRDGGKWTLIPGSYSRSLHDVEFAGDTLWIATHRGLFAWRDGEARRLFKPDEIASGQVRSLAVAPDGRLWVGSSGGIDVYEGQRPVARFSGSEGGLPCTDVRKLRFGSDGVLWVGTERGLGRYDGKNWTWRHSLRWLPADTVLDFAIQPEGSHTRTAWIATDGGLAILKTRPMTLAEKAAIYQEKVRARHVRKPGLVERVDLKTPGDLSTYYHTDTDNDGLFTGLYVAAEAFRHAVTGDASAADNAREGYQAMEFLQTVTGTPGFVARTVVPADWSDVADRNRVYTPQQIAAERVDNPRFKRVENRWRPSADGKWLWKGDTSSDEISGHYFAYALYHDLVAKDDDERKRVADHVRRITDYIIDGGYTLRDIDGKHTLWGVWAPERLSGDPDWQPERGCNSVEMLSFLAVAHHCTGDEKYLRELERLFDREGYSEMILAPKLSAPSEFTYIDDQLLALAYRGLLAYDQDPKRREAYLKSLGNWFEVVRGDHSPLYAFVYGGVMGGQFGADGCVAYLRDTPLDLVDWTVDNRWREDLRIRRLPVVETWQTDRLLPPSERALNKWDGNPYVVTHGANGRSESSGVHWLLPYWMGRYYRILE